MSAWFVFSSMCHLKHLECSSKFHCSFRLFHSSILNCSFIIRIVPHVKYDICSSDIAAAWRPARRLVYRRALHEKNTKIINTVFVLERTISTFEFQLETKNLNGQIKCCMKIRRVKFILQILNKEAVFEVWDAVEHVLLRMRSFSDYHNRIFGQAIKWRRIFRTKQNLRKERSKYIRLGQA